MLKTIIAVAVVTVVILAEVLAACVLFPDRLPSQGGQAASGQSADGGAGPGDKAERQAEVDLGKFSVVIRKPAGGTTRVNFHLVGTVPESQRDEFSQRLAKCQHRLREQVSQEVQQAGSGDLAEPGLALIKRKILERSNDLLGQPLLRTVILSDYSLVEH
jgi:hypothetical protein